MVYSNAESLNLFLVFDYMISNFIHLKFSILDSHCPGPRQEAGKRNPSPSLLILVVHFANN